MPVPPFYFSSYPFRSSKRVRALAFGALIGFFPILALFRGAPAGHYAGTAYIFACIFGPMFLFILTLGAFRLITNPTHTVRIDEMGVTSRGRTYPWKQITMILFSRRSFSSLGWIAFSTQPRRVVSFPLHGHTPLTRHQYLQFIQRLQPWLATYHPHVVVHIPA